MLIYLNHRTCGKPISNLNIEIEEFNPFCGDRVKLQMQFDRLGAIIRISNEVEGCSILQATASMMSEILLGFVGMKFQSQIKLSVLVQIVAY